MQAIGKKRPLGRSPNIVGTVRISPLLAGRECGRPVLLIRRFWVQVLGGAPIKPEWNTAQKSQVPAKEPPTQGHDRDMGTIQNTAALYLRKSSLDDRAGDNRSPYPGGRTLRLSNTD